MCKKQLRNVEVASAISKPTTYFCMSTRHCGSSHLLRTIGRFFEPKSSNPQMYPNSRPHAGSFAFCPMHNATIYHINTIIPSESSMHTWSQTLCPWNSHLNRLQWRQWRLKLCAKVGQFESEPLKIQTSLIHHWSIQQTTTGTNLLPPLCFSWHTQRWYANMGHLGRLHNDQWCGHNHDTATSCNLHVPTLWDFSNLPPGPIRDQYGTSTGAIVLHVFFVEAQKQAVYLVVWVGSAAMHVVVAARPCVLVRQRPKTTEIHGAPCGDSELSCGPTGLVPRHRESWPKCCSGRKQGRRPCWWWVQGNLSQVDFLASCWTNHLAS